jgi:ubiquinone/menaquinone biosynthesis C-methylase UbiE
MDQKNQWSRIAGDFEKRVFYVAGERNIIAIKRTLADQGLTGKVLELGCGNGTYSVTLAPKAERLYVTDVSDQMLSVCKDRLKHLDNVEIEKQNCISLSYPDSIFDSVVMVNLLHVIPEPEKAISESKRVLKVNGKIVVISFTTHGMGLFNKLGMIYRYLRVFGKHPEKSRKLTVNTTKAMLEGQGFKTEEARLIGETSKAVFVKASAR